MKNNRILEAQRTGLLITILILGLVTVLAVALPFQLRPAAESRGSGLFTGTQSQNSEIPNFDIRLDQTGESEDAVVRFRQSLKKDASETAALRDATVRGEDELKSRLPNVTVEYSSNRVGQAEVISPNVWTGQAESLTPPSDLKRSDVLKRFINENSGLIGVSTVQIESLDVAADYTNPDGVLSFAHLEQNINGVPVFAGEIKAGFDRNGQIIRVINNLAPGLEYGGLSKNFGDPADAVRFAAGYISHELRDADTTRNEKESTDLKAVFGKGDWATTAEKMYFPVEAGVAVPSWRVLIWEPENAYYVIVDAESGTMLWRKNITEDQTQASTFNVYRNSNAYIDVADSPAPLTPGPTSPNGVQGSIIARENLTLVGNEGANSFNNNGWVTDGTNVTDGNSNEAGIDRNGINGVDATQVGSPNRVFSSTWNPPPGSPSPGDDPLTAQAQRGAVIQMFYVMNRYHDELYKRGFTEAARNFQQNNFGRGGAQADRVSSEGQDSSGTNNANFSTPADGGRGRMQMYLWTGPTPDYDGTTDADIIIHEVTHGTSNRLHGNSTGLSTNMSRGMGEGWGDFYGHTMLAEPTDPINGIYPTGGYATYLATTGFTSNYYYGIRRFPKAVIAFTGPNGKPHNPLTFRYVNNNCNTLIGSTTSNPPPNSAFPRGPFGSSTCDQVHNLGEVWSSALWEVRSLMVARLGFALGTERALQVVTDGMKLAPTGPTFLQERDAIITAATAYSPEDADDVREGFRRRGMGFGASIQNAGTGANNTAVTESFAVFPGPTPTPVPTVSVSGQVLKSNGRGLSGTTMTLTGGPGPVQTTTTSGTGNYVFSGVQPGFNYTVTPSRNRYTFTPTSQTFLVNGDVSGINFTGN